MEIIERAPGTTVELKLDCWLRASNLAGNSPVYYLWPRVAAPGLDANSEILLPKGYRLTTVGPMKVGIAGTLTVSLRDAMNHPATGSLVDYATVLADYTSAVSPLKLLAEEAK